MVTQQEIERLAYQLWEREGRPSHRALDNYLEAERTLAASQRSAETSARVEPTTAHPAAPHPHHDAARHRH